MNAGERVPLTTQQIILMSFGFFDIQYSFGMQQTAINPIFSFLHATAHQLPLLNMAGLITGLIIQPIIGAMSDRTWSPRWGRRKPYFLIGALGCSLCLFVSTQTPRHASIFCRRGRDRGGCEVARA